LKKILYLLYFLLFLIILFLYCFFSGWFWFSWGRRCLGIFRSSCCSNRVILYDKPAWLGYEACKRFYVCPWCV